MLFGWMYRRLSVPSTFINKQSMRLVGAILLKLSVKTIFVARIFSRSLSDRTRDFSEKIIYQGRIIDHLSYSLFPIPLAWIPSVRRFPEFTLTPGECCLHICDSKHLQLALSVCGCYGQLLKKLVLFYHHV